MADIIVIGGGAGGIAAAIKAAENTENKVLLLEQMDRVGKKILATGNGRCNLSNAIIDKSCYFTSSPELIQQAIDAANTFDVVDFFEHIGLFCEEKEMGRIYPKCGQASMVVDVLLAQLQRSRVNVKCGVSVGKIEKKNNKFVVTDKEGCIYTADKVILSVGGKAGGNLGSDGSGYPMVKALGHSIAPLYPCLVALKSADKRLRALKGIRAVCGVTLYSDGQFIAGEVGEVQFADYGLSGIPLMQLSCHLNGKTNCCVSIDLFEEMSHDALFDVLCDRKYDYMDEPTDTILLGTVNKRLVTASVGDFLKRLPAVRGDIGDGKLWELAQRLKDWRIDIDGPMPYSRAQVTGGGVMLDEIDLTTMESKKCRGLYLCGEILDMVGLCGGYNLHFAFGTGLLAGNSTL